MSTSKVLPLNENSISTIENKKASLPCDEAPALTTTKIKHSQNNGHLENEEEKPETIQRYTKDELLELRTAPLSLKKPDVLFEEYFNKDGIWDPELWFKSKASRSASPAVIDGKPILEEKKSDFYDGDNIELAPRRESFKQGCQVKASPSNSLHRPTLDRKSRLTGRAANQRRPVETNYKDRDSISERTHEFEKMRRDKEAHFTDRDDRFQDRGYRQNDRFSKNKGYSNDRDPSRDHNYKETRNNHDDRRRRENKDDSMPEWMTDGPTSQLDTIELTTHKDIEAEKKAFAKKNKKVRISPDVEAQERMKVSRPPKRKTPSPKQEKESPINQRKHSEKNNGKPGFELDEFLQAVDYYPPDLHFQDLAYGDGVKSRFTQYFATSTKPGITNCRSSSVSNDPLVPDEVFTGSTPPQQPYFTPIQPASALLSAAATAHAVQTSNIANIIQKQREQQLAENLNKTSKEVRGRLNVEELEGASPSKPLLEHNVTKPEAKDKNAFNMFLKTMKDAGQLPEKPSPVVSGLPVHLLPQPPTRTSPVFEKLKRSLSRSPSPQEFVKAVSTVAGILSTNPSIDRELALLQRKNSQDLSTVGTTDLTRTLDQNVNKKPVYTQKTPSSDRTHKESFTTPVSQLKKTPKNAFTPTSVLKKMHNDRKEDCVSPSLSKEKSIEPDVSSVNISSNGKYPDLLPDQVRSEKFSRVNVEQNLDKQFSDAAATAEHSQVDRFAKNGILPFHSAPSTPRNQALNINGNETAVSVSAPGSPNHKHVLDPPAVSRYPLQPPGLRGRDTLKTSRDSAFESLASGMKNKTVLMTPSAFQSVEQTSSQKSVGVIGSGVPQQKFNEQIDLMETLDQLNMSDRSSPRQQGGNPKLAPGNGASLRPSRSHGSPSEPSPLLLNPLQKLANQQQQQQSGMLSQPQSQQQQLLQAQRRAQIQQAQLLQQQKLREIAKHAHQQNSSAPQDHVSSVTNASQPLLPDPEKSLQQQQRPLYQQNQHQQVFAYQQQQKQQQQQMLAQHQRQFRGGPTAGMPFRHGQMHAPSQQAQPHLQMPLHAPPHVGLSPFHQAQLNPGFANVNMTAQALVQQQLISQARARFIQAQILQQQPQVVQAALIAQAALVRGQAQAQAAMMLNPRNRQAMAEQMGLRPQYYQNKVPLPSVTPQHQAAGDSSADGDNVLSKWFSNDVLQKMPASNTPKPAEFMSVEELERKQSKH